MGRKLTERVFEVWGAHLSPAERCAAAYMAAIAHDDGAPPVYWGGWKALAVALGYAHADASQASARSRTMRVLADLRGKGVVTPGGNARPTANGVYALNLDPHVNHMPVRVSANGREVTWRAEAREDPRAPECRTAPAWMGSAEDYQSGSAEDYQSGSAEDYPESIYSNELHQVGKDAGAPERRDDLAPEGEAGSSRKRRTPPVVDDDGETRKRAAAQAAALIAKYPEASAA